MLNAVITGWGVQCPTRVLSNRDLEAMVQTSDAWIVSRTGIHERRVAAPEESSVSLGLQAAVKAIERARVPAAHLDLVIVATTTPDYLLPGSACLVQQKLGAIRAGAFDLNAGCSGFLYALTVACQFLRSGACRKVLLVCSEVLSRFIDWTDRSTCVLFGDGAAAIVLEAEQAPAGAPPAGVLSTDLGSRGDVDKFLVIEAGGGAHPTSAETVANGDHHVRMRGNEIFRMAVRYMTQSARAALAKANLKLEQIKIVIPHQANERIVLATQEALGLPRTKMFVNIGRYGNTGAASIPIALCEYLELAPPEPGDHLLFVSFGGGLTWGAAVVRWADLSSRS